MMIETNSKQGMAFAAAFLSLVSVQIGASIGKALFPILSAEGVTLTRLALAACFLWIVYKPWRGWNRQTNWKNLIIYGAILTLMNTLIYKAFSYMSVGIAISIEVLGPLTVAILMSKNKLDYFWGALSLIGLLFYLWAIQIITLALLVWRMRLWLPWVGDCILFMALKLRKVVVAQLQQECF